MTSLLPSTAAVPSTPTSTEGSTIRQWMTVSPTTFSPSQTVAEARAALVGFRHAPVVESGQLLGYLHACDLAWFDASRRLGSLALANAQPLEADVSLREGLHRLRASRHDIVFVGDPLEGVFTEHDAVRAVLAGLSEAQLALPADRIASRPVDVVAPDTRLGDARAQLASRWFRHLPVVATDGRVVGMISWRDVVAGDDDARCESVMASPVWTVGPMATLSDVARRMLEGRVGAFPLVEDGAVVGILTRTDLFAALLDGPETA